MRPTTAESASVEPTDRSIPRVMMTRSWASASTAITADWLSTLPMLRVLRKTGDREAMTVTTATSIRPGPIRIAVSVSCDASKRRGEGRSASATCTGSVDTALPFGDWSRGAAASA